jgi:V8-like Glu-specific endopeptidase
VAREIANRAWFNPNQKEFAMHSPRSNQITVIYSLLLTFMLSACGNPSTSPRTYDGANGGTSDGPNVSGIVKGHKVKDKDQLGRAIVAIVSEQSQGQALCTGSIIAEDLILTAAHCVEGNPTKLSIVFSGNVRAAKPSDIRLADRFAQNPRWLKQTEKGRGDLALIHFEGGLASGYSEIKLAAKSAGLKPGTPVLVIGYGVTNGTTKVGSGILRETATTVISQSTPTEIMTDGKKSSVCFGDSGGPAFVEINSEFVQWGVASSVTNQTCSEASIHTDLASYLSWIKSEGSKLRKKGA